MIKILVVSPHTDDETLGAGGYLLRHKELGDEIYWINITSAKEEYGYSKEVVKQGMEEFTQVAKSFNFDGFVDLGMEPAGLDKIDKSVFVRRMAEEIRKIEPNIVLVPFPNDVHSDHKVVFDVVYSCCKAFRCPSVERIMCMEIISETDYAVSDNGFVPNMFVDVSKYIDKKIQIMKLYKDEIKSTPFPRNEEAIRGMAKYRAAACNTEYAEAFRIIKEIEK